MGEALDEAREGLSAKGRAAVKRLPSPARSIDADRGAVVLTLSHLLTHALSVTRERGPVEAEIGPPGQPLLCLRFGPSAPVRDEPPPAIASGAPAAVRLTTGLAMAWILATHALGPGSLRAAQSAGSGRLELWIPET